MKTCNLIVVLMVLSVPVLLILVGVTVFMCRLRPFEGEGEGEGEGEEEERRVGNQIEGPKSIRVTRATLDVRVTHPFVFTGMLPPGSMPGEVAQLLSKVRFQIDGLCTQILSPTIVDAPTEFTTGEGIRWVYALDEGVAWIGTAYVALPPRTLALWAQTFQATTEGKLLTGVVSLNSSNPPKAI